MDGIGLFNKKAVKKLRMAHDIPAVKQLRVTKARKDHLVGVSWQCDSEGTCRSEEEWLIPIQSVDRDAIRILEDGALWIHVGVPCPDCFARK
jgi:hypothetical protein